MTLVAFEGVAVATAMPVAARDLDGIGVYSWAFNAYVIASLVGMVLAGTRCDRHGPRGALVAGVALFALGAAAAAAAPTMAWLVAGRALQGFGGGGAIVAVYVLIGRAYDEWIRPRAFTLLSAAWVLPALVGPVIAGTLADLVSWRVVFGLVPVLLVLPAVVLLPVLHRYDGGDGSPRPGRTGAAVVAAAGLALVQDGLLRRGVAGGVEAAVGLALLLLALRTLLPPGSLRLARGLPTTVMMRGAIAAAFFAAEAFIPLALIEQRGVTTTAAGSTLTLAAAGWFLGSFLQGRIPGDRDRSSIVRLGAALAAAAIATLPLALDPTLPPWLAAASWLVGAVGMGLAFPAIGVQTLRLSPPDEQGRNSSALQLADSTASVLGLGIAGSVQAAAVASGGATATTYTVLWAMAAALMAFSAVLAGRMRPPAATA